MHGSVWELCLNIEGAKKQNFLCIRGGGWGTAEDGLPAPGWDGGDSCRTVVTIDLPGNASRDYVGFRVARVRSSDEGK